MESTREDTQQYKQDNIPPELPADKIQDVTENKIEEITRGEKIEQNKQQSKQAQRFGFNLLSDNFDEPEQPAVKPEPPKRPKIRIMAGVVTQDRRISMHTAHSLQTAKGYLAEQNIELKILYIHDKTDYMGKNKLISLFLTTDSTHLLLVGDTLSFTPLIFERLISANKPVICAACPMATRQWQQLVEWSSTRKSVNVGQIPTLLTNYFINVANDKRNRRVLEDNHLFVDFAATDFMFLRRDSIEELINKFGGITICVNVSTQNVENIYTLFEPLYETPENQKEPKTYKSPDETFCSRLRSAGFDIIVDIKSHIIRECSGDLIQGNLSELILIKEKKQ